MSAVAGWYNWITSIDWKPEAITAAGTAALAFLTLVLAIGTVFLWRATRRLVIGSEKIAKRQLRAYIFITGKDGALPAISTAHGIEIWFIARNSGQTPAYKVRQWLTLDFVADPEKGPFPRPSENIKFTEAALGPNSEMPLRAFNPKPISAAQIDAVHNTSLTICIWGEVTYEDTFGDRHYSRVRFLLPVEPGGRMPGLMLAQSGNEAN